MLRLPKFTYHRPKTSQQAVEIVNDCGPEAMYVAGGTDLYPNMKRRTQTPTEVVSLTGIESLKTIEGDPSSGVTIGAMVSLTELENTAVLATSYPGFQYAVETISTPLLRNMGTIGGNLLLDTRCNYYDQNYEWRQGIDFCMKCDGETCWVAPSSPRCWAVQSSDSVPILIAMGCEVTLLGVDGERRIPLVDLYNDDGIKYLSKHPGELLTKVHLPAQDGFRAAYRKLRRRSTWDFPVLGIGAKLRLDGDVMTGVDIRIGGAGSYAIPAAKTMAMLEGQKKDEELIRAAAQEAFKPTRAMDNTDHEAKWRKKMAPVFVRRAIMDCL